MTGDRHHWDSVYESREETATTWFEEKPDLSLRLITSHSGPEDAVIDVGGGASRLVDALLDLGYGHLSVLDLSAAALAISRARLGQRSRRVRWIEADVTSWHPDARYRVWHDRAVFHFLTDERDRCAYLARMAGALVPGGHAVLSTFAEDGPETCSGLPVERYSPEALAGEVTARIPSAFEAVSSERHVHITPRGGEQRFQVSVFRRL